MGAEATTRPVPLWTLAVPVAVVVLAVGVGVGVVVTQSSQRSPWVGPGTAAVGSPAPDFSSWTFQGKQVRLSSLKGRPVVLSFWATWCTACQSEFPELQRIESERRGGGLVILAVDYKETDTGAMQRFLDRLGVGFQGVVDPQGVIASAYRVDIGLPVNVWINRDQNVAAVTVGAKPAADLESMATKIAT